MLINFFVISSLSITLRLRGVKQTAPRVTEGPEGQAFNLVVCFIAPVNYSASKDLNIFFANGSLISR